MRYALVAAGLLLGACTTGADRAAYLNTLVGQPEGELVRQLGVPNRVYEADGHKFLAYVERQPSFVTGGSLFLGGGYGYGYGRGYGYGSGFGYDPFFPAEVIPRQCETTFDVGGGRVLSWALRGNACG